VAIPMPRRSQAWFRPGRYVPVSYVHGLEVLADSRGGVRLGDGTLHGTAVELRALAVQMLRRDQGRPAWARRRRRRPGR
jgi:hypothetical protein